jgi:nucleoid DNA-binding protein
MAKKAAPKAAEAKPAAAAKVKAATKADIYSAIAEKTGLSKKQVASVLETWVGWAGKELGKKGPGIALIPGMAKVKAVRKAATKAKTVPNPFKPGEMMTVKAKPARTTLKIVALKAFKEGL